MYFSPRPSALILTVGIASLVLLPICSDAFVAVPQTALKVPTDAANRSWRRPRRQTTTSLPPPTCLFVVETFDGSTIVDPVVVSNVFWASFKAKFLSMILGQLLATLFFGLFASIAAAQLTVLTDWIKNNNAMKDTAQSVSPQPSSSAFKKAGESPFPNSGRR